MTLSPLVLGTLPEKPAFLETLIYQVNGLIIVFVVLGALWLLVELSGYIFKRRDERQAASKKSDAPDIISMAAAPAKLSEERSSEYIGPALAAIISAAVHVTVGGRPHRMVAILPTTAAQHHHGSQSSPWAAEGRREILTSHKLR